MVGCSGCRPASPPASSSSETSRPTCCTRSTRRTARAARAASSGTTPSSRSSGRSRRRSSRRGTRRSRASPATARTRSPGQPSPRRAPWPETVVLYDRIGVGYDTTRRADPGIARQLVELLGVPAGGACLDVACGTGNYTTALAGTGLRMHGVEISPTMLDAAREKSRDVRWVNADATAIPFRDGTFQGALVTLALHHFREPAAVFREVA